MNLFSPSRARKPRRRTFLALESLDERVVPATIGVVNPQTATWYLRSANGPGPADAGVFQYGGAGWRPVSGDWNGDDRTTIGVVDTTSSVGATWYLRNANSAGQPDVTPFTFGLATWTPLTGDWNGDGTSTVGSVDTATATWFLRNSNTAGGPDAFFQFGLPGWIPVAGDWDGNGTVTIGSVDPSTGTWYLRNSNSAGAADATFQYGGPGWTPVVGDWDNNGTTTIASINPASNTWYIRNSNTGGGPDIAPFVYGAPGWTPVVGDWQPAQSVTLTNNLQETSGGVLTPGGATQAAGSFRTDASSYSLNSVTLLLANQEPGQMTLRLFSGTAERPTTEIATLTPPASFSVGAAPTTFTATGITLAPNTYYWVVMSVSSGQFHWSTSDNDNGTGPGFRDTWAYSFTGGQTWDSQVALPPPQFSVIATRNA